jgi:hypothetical protein
VAMNLETRTCQCGCGTAFRTLPTSQQHFASRPCEEKTKPWLFNKGVRVVPKTKPRHDIIDKVERELKKKLKPPASAALEVLEPSLEPAQAEATKAPHVIEYKDLTAKVDPDELEARWKRYITQAKTHVINLNRDRMAIAKIAAEACTIHYGGGDHWKNFDGVYTLKRFAAEIKINPKTLSNWVATYRFVVLKLPDGTFDQNNFEAARRTRNMIDRNTPEEEVTKIYQKELNSSQEREYLVRGIKRLKTLHYYLTKKANLSILGQQCSSELDECHRLCDQIVDAIENNQQQPKEKA